MLIHYALFFQFNIGPSDRLQQIEDLPVDKFADGSQQMKKVVKLRRFKPSFPKLRPGEVVFIDLTAENEENKQGNGKKKKKKKDKKKLKWLKEVRKKSKVEKKGRISDKTWVEKALAHSTEDNINQEMKISTNERPISEDKVSESTERIESTVANDRRFEKNDCDTTCRGCKFCNSMGRAKYNDEQGAIESSENLVTSQTSPLNSDAVLLKNAVYIDKEFYFHPDTFENDRSCENLVNRIKQESKDSRIYNSKNISESQSFFCTADQAERRATVKTMKQEPQDVIDDSTTEKNCDKMILNDSSSFNVNMEEDLSGKNAALPVVKLEPGNTTKANGAMPFKLQSRTRYKLSKTKHRESRTCVVSTTASMSDFGTGEQINIISGSTSELIEPDLRSGDLNFRRGLNSNANCNAESSDKQAAINFKKLSSTSKLSKSSKKEISNSYENSHEETVNKKLQHSLIHALSLDEIIQIGRDDVDSQSEGEENKGRAVDGGPTENSLKNSNSGDDESDFFQMPDVQLCDDLTSGSEIKNLVTAGAKNKIDDFENIDILDSILNGDLSMEDILEEQQHLSMCSTGLDSSANMLGFFTEFFKQSETTQSLKKNCLMGQNFHLDEVAESLPEGSLGTTGILNSLLDSDLTSIDSPPSDFMYSNVQTVDPRLIRKSPTAERVVLTSDFGTASDLISQNEQSAVENFLPVDSLSKKTKDQLFLDKKDSLNCTDLEEFGLNNAKQTSFEMPVLEEELIQLSQHPLIDETMITQISPRACESSLSTCSDTENLNMAESTTSPDFNDVQFPTENNYEYSKLNHLLHLKDVSQNPVSEIRPGEDLPTSTLTDFTPPQSVDPPQSPYTFALSPASMYSQTVPHSPTHSIGTLHHPLAANILTPPPSMPQLMRQNNLTPPPTPQQGGNSIGENQGGQRSRVKFSPMKSQFLSSAGIEDELVSSVQNEERCEIGQQKSRAKVTYIVRSKKNAKAKAGLSEVGTLSADPNDREESLRLAEVQVALTRLTAEQINARANREQSLLKSQIFVKREADTPSNLVLQTPQLQCIDLRKFGIATQPNKSVLINLNGKTKPALIFERNAQSEKLLKNFHDNVATRANVVYKLTSNLNPATSKGKPYSKIPKVNSKETTKREPGLFVEVPPPSSVTARCNPRNKTSEDKIKKVMRPRSSTKCVKAQASKSTKELNVRQTLAVPNSEEPSMKKRKITSKVMPLLEKEGISYNVNQQKAQEKCSNVIRRGNLAMCSFFTEFKNRFVSISTRFNIRGIVKYFCYQFSALFKSIFDYAQLDSYRYSVPIT